MGCGSVLQLSPEVPQLRRQSIHGALGWMGSSDGAAPSFTLSPHHWLPAGPAELSTFSSKHGPSRWPARPSVIPQCLVSTIHVAGLSRRLGDSQSRAVPPPSDGDSQGRAEAPHTAWSLPQGRAMPPLRQGVPPGRAVSPGSDGDPPTQSTLPGPAPAGSEHLASVAPSPTRWWPGCAVYPSTFLTAPSSRTPSGTRPGRSGEQRAWGWLVLGACSGLSPTLCWEICPLGT